MCRTKITRAGSCAICTAFALLVFGGPSLRVANAELTLQELFNGNVDWSVDGVGGVNSPVGTIQAVVPAGSTVERAYLYSTLNDSVTVPTVDFDGTVYNGADFIPLGVAGGFLQAHRADVTAQVAAKIGGGGGAPFDFVVNSETPHSTIDGEVLAIVYSNPGAPEGTVAIFDGFSAFTGDSFDVMFAGPVDTTVPGFQALMSLGIGFGNQQIPATDQRSEVDINGRRLTSNAGAQDDAVPAFLPPNGVPAGGTLITVGGLGDDPTNPPDPFDTSTDDPRADDELYNLALGNGIDATPYILNGDEGFVVNTLNPSDDDNIFFMALNVTARAAVDNIPPTADDDMTTATSGETVMHTFTGNDPDDGPDSPLVWSFDSLTGPAAAAIPPTFNTDTQEFAWDTTGSELGMYFANVIAFDGQASDTGTLKINLVPEPSGIVLGLIGLLTVGFFGLRLKRRTGSS